MAGRVSVCTRDQAQETANKIMEYWSSRGYVVDAKVAPMCTKLEDGEGLLEVYGYNVRTDMINGLPRELYHQKRRALL